MKTTYLFASLLLIGAGCSNNVALISDFQPIDVAATPLSGVERGAYDRQIKTAISYDGLNYIQNDGWIGGQMNVPDAIVRPNGDIYLYFTGQTLGQRFNETAVAISQDQGSTWTYKYLELTGNSPLGSNPVDPDVVQLEDGTIRMYVTASERQSQPAIYRFESQDGITFEYMGVSYKLQDEALLDSTTFYLDDMWHMYVMKDREIEQQVHLISDDGIEFTFEGLSALPYEGTPQMPSNGMMIDDTYHLFMFDPADGRIRSMRTTDGYSFYPNEGFALEPVDGETYVIDPTVIQMDEYYLMFYVTNM